VDVSEMWKVPGAKTSHALYALLLSIPASV